jgi:hypothetical protein
MAVRDDPTPDRKPDPDAESKALARQRLTRRRFLVIGGVGVAGAAAGSAAALAIKDDERPTVAPTSTTGHDHQQATATTAASRKVNVAGARPWSDPDSWPKGGVPEPGDVAVVTGKVLLDTDAKVAGVTVERAGELIFDPSASHTLASTGNVVVEGKLVMRPASAAVEQLLVFEGVDEAQMVGGGMDPVKSDVGLWVMGAGALDLQGSAKLPWTRVSGAVTEGTIRLSLQDPPAGWRPGDELVITPTLPPDAADAFTAYDSVRVRAVRGRTVTLDRATRFNHPTVDLGRDASTGRVQTAEVLNLTRNVAIEGTPGHRAHIFIRSSKPQTVVGAGIRHMGPRKPGEGGTQFVLGRYGLHFHMCGNGSRGSVVDGVAIHDSGSHAFVPHLSNGITFRGCISHNTFEEAFWWDGAPDTRTSGDPSHDILYDRCVASLVRNDPSGGYRLAGFFIGGGRGNTIRGSVAVGVQGMVQPAGFIWPEGSEGIWTFEDCVAHNNGANGIFTWQNTPRLHVISNFTAYHNHGAGISHGAYNNRYTYKDSVLYGNREGAVILHADSWGGPQSPLQFVNLACNAAGQSDYLVVAPRHNGDNELPPPRFVNCSFTGAKKAAFGWTYQGEDGESTDEIVDVIDCRFEGTPFWLASGIGADSRIRVKDPVHGSIVLRRVDRPGTLVSQWNARTEQNPGFTG